MTFVLADEPDAPNPVHSFHAAGERVRLVLKNEAPGLLHDVAIPAWDVAGDADPCWRERRGDVYGANCSRTRTNICCRPHAEMMTGVIEVQRS